jgi:hypothetical protein
MSRLAKLAMIAALIAICVGIAFAIDASVLTIGASRVGGETRPPIDPTETMKRAPHDLPVEQFDAH